MTRSFAIALMGLLGLSCSCRGGDDPTLPPAERFRCDGNVYIGSVRTGDATELARLRDIQCLKGDLVIGQPNCRGTPQALPDLAVLSTLRVVEGDVIINGAAGALTDLAALKRVRRLRVCNSPELPVALPGLVSADVVLQSTPSVTAPQLEASGLLSVQSDSLVEIDLPAMKSIGRLAISASPKLERLSLPVVDKIESIDLRNLPRFEALVAPGVTSVGDVRLERLGGERDRPLDISLLSAITALEGSLAIDHCPTLATVDVSRLARVLGDVRLDTLDGLKSVNAPALHQAQALVLRDLPKLATLDVGPLKGTLSTLEIRNVPALHSPLTLNIESIREQLVVDNTGLTGLSLSALTSVRGDLTLEKNPRLSALELGALKSVGGQTAVKDNNKLASSAVDGLFPPGPRVQVCGQQGGAPCSFAPPRKQYEALPTSLRFIRDGKNRAYASESVDDTTALSLLRTLGIKEKRIAKAVPSIFIKSRVSDAFVVVRGKKGTGPVTEWQWYRAVPSRGFVKIASGKPKASDKLVGVRAFVDFDEAVVLGEIGSKGKRDRDQQRIAVYRIDRRDKKSTTRLGVVDVARAKSAAIAKRGIEGARVGLRDGLEVSFHSSDESELPLVFRRGADAPKFVVDDALGTALKPGESRSSVVLAAASDDAVATAATLPTLSAQNVDAATAVVGGCKATMPLPACPAETSPLPPGPPTSNVMRCRRQNGLEHGPAIQYHQYACPNDGDTLVVFHRGNYRDGRQEGVWDYYRPDGSPSEQVTYADGERTGPSRQYDEKGRVDAEGMLEKGRRVGRWKVRREGRMKNRVYKN